MGWIFNSKQRISKKVNKAKLSNYSYWNLLKRHNHVKMVANEIIPISGTHDGNRVGENAGLVIKAGSEKKRE